MFHKNMGLIKKFVNKCLSLARLGANWMNKLISGLVEAGRTISYIETVAPSQADTIHKAVKICDRNFLTREYKSFIRKNIHKLTRGPVKIAIDITEDLTWAKQGQVFMRPSAYDHHIQSWKFVNVGIVDPHFIPLLSVPYSMFDDLSTLVIELLEFVNSLKLSIELVLFDRGFYNMKILSYLENPFNRRAWSYLMLVKKDKAIHKLIKQSGTLGVFNHKLGCRKQEGIPKAQTTILIHKKDLHNPWVFATN
jgi:hypothetical protein